MITILLLIIIYLSFISLGLPDSLLGSAWPTMYGDLSVPLYYAGIISMIIAGGTVVSSLFSGKIIRRFGTGIVTISSVFMTAAALIGFSFSHNFLYLCFWAVPLGIGAGAVDSALNNYVALHYKAKHMNWLHCFWGVGASIGPLIMSAYLANGDTWILGYRTVGIIQFFLVVILFFSLPLWNKNKTNELQMQTEKHKTITYWSLFNLPGMKQILVAFFSYCTIEAITGLWGASYLVTIRNISPEDAARWIALYYIGITAGRFISGFLSIRLNNRQMVRLGQSLIACGIVMLLLPFNYLLLAGFFTIGLGCAPIYPSLLHETPHYFGKEYSQVIMGMQMASAYIGTTLMPPLFGRLATFFDFSVFPIFVGAVLIIKILMTEIVNKKCTT
jgi:fucose permease